MSGGALIQSFWHGANLPRHCTLCLKSFVDLGHQFHLYTYDDGVAVPEGITLRDAREVLPESSVFFYQIGDGVGSVAGFSNRFRYKLLLEQGGWWVDTDVLCLSSTLPAQDIVFGEESAKRFG